MFWQKLQLKIRHKCIRYTVIVAILLLILLRILISLYVLTEKSNFYFYQYLIQRNNVKF